MKYKLIILLAIITSCTHNLSSQHPKSLYSAKGFAYIYTNEDYNKKLIKKKFTTTQFQISHNKLKSGTLIKLMNPITKDFIILKASKKVQFPDLYKVLITEPVANKLNLRKDLPLVEILEVKKNKSFIAEKSKIYNEEKKIHSNAPVELVKIDNISKNKKYKKKSNNNNIFIIVAEFYSNKSAVLLKERIVKELTNFDSKKLSIRVKKTNKISLISGPYRSINLMKNDYIQLKNFGFEELDISINE